MKVNGCPLDLISMSLEPIHHPWAGMGSLPQEVFDKIACDLERRDLVALSYVSKAIRALADFPLYAHITVRDKRGFASISRTLLSNPHLCDIARSCWIGKDAPWWSLDLLSSFSDLCSFVYRPKRVNRDVTRMLQNIADGGWIPSTLKQCKYIPAVSSSRCCDRRC